MNVYVINRIARTVPLTETFKGVMPFLASDFLRIAALLFFPALSLALVHASEPAFPTTKETNDEDEPENRFAGRAGDRRRGRLAGGSADGDAEGAPPRPHLERAPEPHQALVRQDRQGVGRQAPSARSTRPCSWAARRRSCSTRRATAWPHRLDHSHLLGRALSRARCSSCPSSRAAERGSSQAFWTYVNARAGRVQGRQAAVAALTNDGSSSTSPRPRA